ncbi:izumo sperm-egg fusion protein 1 [Genypterus blacodes]|uniref:izumo sperm-egg fusion protein 1 n=1 Tax=Genypterus blacodes TaxID=154954 RepID=UPI003F768A1D
MRLLDCSSCQRVRIECRRKDCGDHTMQVMEGGQAVLDCFLPWHSRVLGKPEYFYSWSPGEPGSKKLKESDFRGLLVTKESFFVLNEVLVEEQGTYRCSLQDKKGTVFSRITFRLTVTNDNTKPTPRRVTLPILPRGDKPPEHHPTGNQWEQVIITVTAVSLAASVGFMIALGIVIRRKGEAPTAG